jgi:glycerol kinase
MRIWFWAWVTVAAAAAGVAALTRDRGNLAWAFGAACAAGLAVGFWSGLDELRGLWAADREWRPAMDPAARDRDYARWKKAVTRTFDWVDG